MQRLSRADLMSLEQYASERARLRSEVIAHKLLEMLRAEKIFESEGIQGELDAYNPLIPDGNNWKVTLLLEFPDPEERHVALGKLIGVEDRCWMQVGEMDRVFAIADEDLERENAEKTSAVHFLRFDITPSMAHAMKGNAPLSVGVDHDNYRHSVSPLPQPVRDVLSADLD